MSLSSLQLDAFLAVARESGFSAAAKRLGLTQSALSQRVLNLEEELGATLFLRESSGIRLTEQGQRLLRYCGAREALEAEFVGQLSQPAALSGHLRIAAFSSISRSLLLPLLARLTRDHPEVQVEVQSLELREILPTLTSGRADFAFLMEDPAKQGLQCYALGFEENVLVRATGGRSREDVFLDHDADDRTTFDFFRQQGKKSPSFRRSYLDEIYSILEGVRLGLGSAVVPRHLAEGRKGIEIVSGYRALKVPVYLCHYAQQFPPALHQEFLGRAREELPPLLSHS